MTTPLFLALSMVASWAAAVAHGRALALATFPAAGTFPGVGAVLGALAAALTSPTGASLRALAAGVEAWASAAVDAAPDRDHDALVSSARDVRAVLLDAAEELDAPRPAAGFPAGELDAPPDGAACEACGERPRMPLCARCLAAAVSERAGDDDRGPA